MEDLEAVLGMGAEELVDGAGGAGELGVVVIVNNDDSLAGEARSDESKAGLNGAIEVAVTEGKGDLGR